MIEMNTPSAGDPADCPPEPHPFDGQFEPPAEAVAKDNPRIPLSEIAAASLAISMKRIADHLSGTDQRSGLVDALYDINRPA